MKIEKVIQVAGVVDQAEAQLLVDAGVQFLGFPLRLPVNQEDLTEEAAAVIFRELKSPCHGVLITYLDRAEEIIACCDSLGAKIVQLHGGIDRDQLDAVKTMRPDLTVFKSLVTGLYSQHELIEQIEELGGNVDAFITDTYDPKTGAAGATGKTHEWKLSRDLVEASDKPVILAGGLTPENVREAIESVRPAGVDAHTGLEGLDGRKDRDKVIRFVAEARAGFGS